MSQFKRFNASENGNYDSGAAYPEGTLTWDSNNGLRIHDGNTGGGNSVGGSSFSGNYWDLNNRPNGASAIHDVIGGGNSADTGKFLMQTDTSASAWTTLPTTYDTLTIDTKIIGGIDNAAGTQITSIDIGTLGSGAPWKYVFLSGNEAFGDLFNRGSSIIGWKMYTVGNPGSFVTITEYLNNDLGGPSLGFSGPLPQGPWTAESSDYNAGTLGPLKLAADTAEWVLGTDGILTLPAAGELADTGVEGAGTIITISVNAAGDTVDYVGGASVLEVPTNDDTNLVQAGWIITFPDSTQRTVSSTGQAGGYTSIYYSESNPGLGGGTYPLTIQSADYVAHVAGAVTVTKGDATWGFGENGYIALPAGGSISDYDAGEGDTSIGSSLTGYGYSQIYWDGAPGTGNPFNGSDLFSWMYVDEQGITLGYANADASKDFEWKFNTDGNLTLPAGGDIKNSSGASVLVTDVNQLADSSSLLPAAQVRYEMKSASFTAVAGKTYWIDSTSGTLTVTLPASPTTGDWVSLYDAEFKWQTNNLTVSGDGNNIRIINMGGSPTWASPASTVTLNQPGWGPTGPLPNKFVWNGSVWSGAM